MANELTTLPKKELVEQVEKKLTEMITDRIKAFPNDFNHTRFVQNCVAVLQDTKDIEKCKPLSIVRTMIKGAYLGLDFFRRECYAIPYGDVLNFQTDYKGEIKLAKKYGRGVREIYAKLVQEGDDIEIGIDNGIQKLRFTPKPFNDGKIVGVFAVVTFSDGTMKYDTMSVKDVEDTRKNYSKAPNSPAWIKSWGEQAKKTVLRRLCKLIDLDFDNPDQQKAYEDGGDADIHTDKPVPEPTKVEDPFAKKPEKPTVEDAEIVPDPDADLKAALRKQYPGEEDWQIEVRIKESRGQA